MRKKLIEVALPLEAINEASAREKSIRHGHPSTLHLWWARRPLAAARAVIFAQMVDDPSANPDLFPTEKDQEKERKRLFRIIADLVKWENTGNESVLQAARDEIWQSWRRACAENVDHPRARELFNRHKLPAFHDPFAGGGALPLEGQRLGLDVYASDLNPVAVLINKAMIEIPPKFAGMAPVNSEGQRQTKVMGKVWRAAEGLGEDVRYYGQWVREEAERRIGNLYPKVEITSEMAKGSPEIKQYVGKRLTVIAWIWARTVKSPNPAFASVDVPLTSTFMLSAKAGKEAYIEPVIEGGTYQFVVKVGKPNDPEAAKNGTKLARGANFRCLVSGTPIPPEYVYREANSGRMGARLMAVVAEGERGRVYLSPAPGMEDAAKNAVPKWKPDVPMPGNPRWFSPPLYGLKTFGDLFTPRQLVALTTFSDLVQEAHEMVCHDAVSAGLSDDTPLRDGGTGAKAYADAIAIYLGFQVDQLSNHLSTVCAWHVNNEQLKNTFARQAIPMVWDYAETNPLSSSTGSLSNLQERQVKGFQSLASIGYGSAKQADATVQLDTAGKVVSTDPPYYDNIGYADLSDFFYVWLRRTLKAYFPELFATVAVPKAEELVATPYRHGSKEAAEDFFLTGMTKTMHRLSEQTHPAFPVTIYYAFKQTETDVNEGVSSTGWDTFLDAVIRAGFSVNGTWPVRTEQTAALKTGTNALASSIVLVCRHRKSNAPTITRREFIAALRGPTAEDRIRLIAEFESPGLIAVRREEIRRRLEENLPAALAHLQRSNIAPVDLAQAAIGPGMAVFSRNSKVLDASGKPLAVREALSLINQTLDEVLAEQEGDFDPDTRWAVSWFEQSGFAEGEYGIAETLSKAKNTSVSGLEQAGILKSKAGKVRLLRPEELAPDWDPLTDSRLTVWEAVHHLIRTLEKGGEAAAAELAAVLGGMAEMARELAYRLYTICERKKRAQEALSYNALVQSWPEITRLAREGAKAQQAGMFT